MISCTEFIPAYSELFTFLDEKYGRAEVDRLWDFLFAPTGKGIPLINFAKKDGVKGCASIVMDMYGSNAENAKALAYRLYTICERKNWAQEGFAYNNLVVAWPEIQAMAADLQATKPVQVSLADLLQNNE